MLHAQNAYYERNPCTTPLDVSLGMLTAYQGMKIGTGLPDSGIPCNQSGEPIR